jgi:hypothetical protein
MTDLDLAKTSSDTHPFLKLCARAFIRNVFIISSFGKLLFPGFFEFYITQHFYLEFHGMLGSSLRFTDCELLIHSNDLQNAGKCLPGCNMSQPRK